VLVFSRAKGLIGHARHQQAAPAPLVEEEVGAAGEVVAGRA
jgi:hypothetical protein